MVLPGFELIKQGAEAKLYQGQFLGKRAILKERFHKKYRHPVLDSNINKERLKAEGRALLRSKIAGVRSPTVYFVDVKKGIIVMEDVDGETAKDCINRLQSSEDRSPLDGLTRDIGEALGRLHADNLIHGDLTTSNMIVSEDSNRHLVLIDFGLSHVSNSAEDKAVDLYVLERAIISTHPNSDEIFNNIVSSYVKTYKDGSKSVLHKFEEVRARGRKRTMVG